MRKFDDTRAGFSGTVRGFMVKDRRFVKNQGQGNSVMGIGHLEYFSGAMSSSLDK